MGHVFYSGAICGISVIYDFSFSLDFNMVPSFWRDILKQLMTQHNACKHGNMVSSDKRNTEDGFGHYGKPKEREWGTKAPQCLTQ